MDELREKRFEALKEASAKMVEFVNQYCTPHDVIVVRQGSVEMLCGELSFPAELPRD